MEIHFTIGLSVSLIVVLNNYNVKSLFVPHQVKP